MSRKLAAIALSLGCLHTGSVMALGLGELKLESFLNEPLKAQVDLLNTGNLHSDEIRVRLATREDFEKMGLERAYFLTGIKFSVETDGPGGPRIVVTSDDPVLEPYLDFIVEARWPNGRLLREYTVLVDPPVFDSSNPVVSATQRVQEVEGVSPDPVKKTEQPAASEKSGTQVKLMQSSLGPGEMPGRGFNAQTSDTPLPGRRYMIHRDDTLWEIAQQARPAGASVHQTMLDIQRLNPEAFIGGNINRIKAGYIVYLPAEEEISSADTAAAMAEVRQQNEDWRAGRDSESVASSGPTLRISAEEPGVSREAESRVDQAPERDTAASAVAMEEADRAALESSDDAEKLAAMEQQLDTLNRIVSLKDEQIAALQAALAEAQGLQDAAAADIAAVEADTTGAPEAELAAAPEADALAAPESETMEEEQAAVDQVAGLPTTDTAAEDDAQPVAVVEEEVAEVAVQEQAEAAAEPAPAAPTPAPARTTPPAAPADGGFMDYLLYILGAAVLAVIAFVLMRRRGGEEGVAETAPVAPAEDVFADVKLREQALKVEPPAEEPAPAAPEPRPGAEVEPVAGDSRGYGERKHDEYASDVDAGDALAEADIYIAYGRYPQAIDLLVNALVNEPGNTAYRLKLLQLYAETGDTQAAQQQYQELQSIGDAASLERAGAVMADLGQEDAAQDPRRFIQPEPESARESAAAPRQEPPVELLADDAPLEADFSGLEIEEVDKGDSVPEELDLSADFADSELARGDDEDLVIAAEGDGLSTKLDLARAYLDMGDEDGARQILEEVIAEGGDELKAEAGTLLERIG